jgi:hypothetical protein
VQEIKIIGTGIDGYYRDGYCLAYHGRLDSRQTPLFDDQDGQSIAPSAKLKIKFLVLH